MKECSSLLGQVNLNATCLVGDNGCVHDYEDIANVDIRFQL